VCFDLGVALLFHKVDFFEFLLFFTFISIFFVHVSWLALTNQFLSIINLWFFENLTLFEVIIYSDLSDISNF
jgi:hypothetical protein